MGVCPSPDNTAGRAGTGYGTREAVNEAGNDISLERTKNNKRKRSDHVFRIRDPSSNKRGI